MTAKKGLLTQPVRRGKSTFLVQTLPLEGIAVETECPRYATRDPLLIIAQYAYEIMVSRQ